MGWRWGRLRRRPWGRFRAASVPRGRSLGSAVVVGRVGFLTAGTWSGVGAGRRRGCGSRIMRDAPFDAIAVGRGVSGTWGMRERPRLRRRAQIGASCRSGSRETAPGDHCNRLGGRGVDWVLNGGHLESGGGGSPARGGSRGMHSSTIDASVPSLAVLRVPYVRSTARPAPDRLRCRAMHARRAATRLWDDRTRSGARRYPRRTPRHRPGGPLHPPQMPAVISAGRQSPDRGSRPPPPGTDAGRNGPMDAPVRRPSRLLDLGA